MEDLTVLAARTAIQKAMQKNKAWHIGYYDDGTPALDTDSMQNELENGLIGGWLGLKAVEKCTLSQWSAAMELLISEEFNKQCEVDRFDFTNKYDR